MHLIREDLLEQYSDKLFYQILVEYLRKSDKILHAKDFFEKERDDEFDWEKRNEYKNEFPVKDIKEDLFRYVKQFIRDVNKLPEVEKCVPDPSDFFGFSDYVYLYFKRPTNPELWDFYDNNPDLYQKVKIRFSDHEESEKHKNDPLKASKINVDWYQRTFLQAAAEMMFKIRGYIGKIHRLEKEYLDGLNEVPVQESFKLRIKE